MYTTEFENIRKGIASGLSGYEEILTVKEAAKILKVSNGKIYDMVHSKELISIRLGRCIRITKTSIINLLASAQPAYVA